MQVKATVKKQAGFLVLLPKSLEWRAQDGQKTVIDLTTVTGMQATPPTAANCRVLLKGAQGVLLKADFHDRETLNTLKESLQKAIQAAKNQPAPEPQEKPEPAKKPEKRKTISLEKEKLLANLDLQRKVLAQDKDLARTFEQVVVSGPLSNEQFWSMRLNTLMSFAQQLSQLRGSYNVLSTIKPVTTSDNKINLSLTRDKILDIFDQYPIVRKAYNDTVPAQLSEFEFWQRFFTSRLFLTLRGERIAKNYQTDGIIDKYIGILANLNQRKRKLNPPERSDQLRPFLNLDGNAQDAPENYGNASDPTMRLSTDGSQTSLIRTMNSLSHRLLRNSSTVDHDGEMEQQIVLTDLQDQRNDTNYVPLSVDTTQEPQNESVDLEAADAFRKEQLAAISSSPVDLASVQERLGDNGSSVLGHITGLCKQAEANSMRCTNANPPSYVNIDAMTMCQITTIEFLRHFWCARNTNEPVDKFASSLRQSIVRINAVVSEAGPSAKKALEPLVQSIEWALAQ